MTPTDVLEESVAPETTTDTTPTEAAPAEDAASLTSGADESTDGRPRDEKGRFVQKTAQEIADEDAGSAVPAPTGDNPQTEPAVAGGSAPATPTEATPEPTPLSIRALGTDYALPGAVLQADGSATFSPEAVKQVHQLFGRAILLHKREAEINQQRAELRAQQAAIAAELKVMDEDVWSKLKGSQSVEEFQENAAELWLAQKNIDERRTLARDRAMITTQQQPPEISQDELRESLERDLESSLAHDLSVMQQALWAKGLTREDWKWLADQTYAIRGQFVVQQQDGYYYNSDASQGYVERLARRIVSEREKVTATARQAQDAAKKNAAAGVTAVKAPPTIGTASGPSGKPAAPKGQAAGSTQTTREQRRQAERDAFEHWKETGEDKPWQDFL